MLEFRRISMSMLEVSLYLTIASRYTEVTSVGEAIALVGLALFVAVVLGGIRRRLGDQYWEIGVSAIGPLCLTLPVISFFGFSSGEPVAGFFALTAAFSAFCYSTLGPISEERW